MLEALKFTAYATVVVAFAIGFFTNNVYLLGATTVVLVAEWVRLQREKRRR